MADRKPLVKLSGRTRELPSGDTVAVADVNGAVSTSRTVTINGTTNQITSSAGAQDLSANRTWTLSLPQNIHTGAGPQFASLTINTATLALVTTTEKAAVSGGFSTDSTGTNTALGLWANRFGSGTSALFICYATSAPVLAWGAEYDGTNLLFNSNATACLWRFNGVEMMRLTNGGKLGIDCSPTHTLQLGDDDAAKTTTNTWTTTSDKKTKKNIRPFKQGLDVLRELKPVEFEYNGEYGTPKGETCVGLVAQEVQKRAPLMVRKLKRRRTPDTHIKVGERPGPAGPEAIIDRVPTAPEEEILGLNTHNLQHIHTNSILELEEKLNAALARITELEANQ